MARSKKKGRSRSRSKKKTGTISVDFEGVESGGGRPVPDGMYLGAPTKITEEEGEDSGEPYLAFRWKTEEGLSRGTKKGVGGIVFDNVSLQPQSLWKLRTILECMGYEVEDGPMDVDIEDLVGEQCGIEVTNEEWEGRDRPRITGFAPPEGEGESEEEEEEPEEEEEEDYEEEEEPEEEEEEPEEEEEEKPSRKKKGKSRSKKLRVGSKVKFKDEEGDWVKGVITEKDDDVVVVEDSAGDSWEVDESELKAA